MQATTRPFGSSLDRMTSLNRVFDHAFNAALTGRTWVPPLDVAERGDAYIVYAELPGAVVSCHGSCFVPVIALLLAAREHHHQGSPRERG